MKKICPAMPAAMAAALTALFLWLPLVTQAAQVQLGLVTAPNPVLPGGTTLVKVLASEDGTDRLLGGAFSLGFDARLLEVVDVTLIAPQDVAGTTGTVVTAGELGTLTGVGFASFSGASGAFEIAAITFRALGPLGVASITAFDADDLVYAWASESLQPVTVLGASATVSVVPEPASALMLTMGAGVIGWATRRRGQAPTDRQGHRSSLRARLG